MQAFFSSDGNYGAQFLVVFVAILPVMVGGYLLYRRLFGRGSSLTAAAGSRGRQPRLGIVDIYELDRQRQLILLRRDNVEHLLLVGGPNDVVIERHIQRGAGARYAPESAADPALAAGPEPALDTVRAEKFLDSPAPPSFAMPEVVPPAVPGAEPLHAERTPPLDPGLFEPEEARAAPARTASPMSRLIRRTPPPLVNPRPEAAPEAAAARPEAVSPAPAAAAPAMPASEPVPETPPVIAGRGPRPVDPAVLSDMARQLQVALKRPSSAVTPPPNLAPEAAPPAPAPAAMPAPAPSRPPEPAAKPAAQPDPLAAAMAAAQADPLPPAPASTPAPSPSPAPAPASKPATAPAPAKPTAPAQPAPAPKPAAKPAPKPAAPPATPAEAKLPEAVPASAPPPKPAAEAKPAPAKPEPSKPEAAKPEPAKPEPVKPAPAPAESGAQGQNPFSVEEIEAEFARLLGRPLDTKG